MMRRREKPSLLPPEYSLPPEFAPPAQEFAPGREAAIPPEHTTAPEQAALKDEFSSGSNPASRSPRSRRVFQIVAAFALIGALTLLPALAEPSIPAPPEPVPAGSMPEPSPTEAVAEPSSQPDESEQTAPCSLYLTYVSGSYCLVDVDLIQPETIASAHLTLTDSVSGLQFYTVELSRAEIDAGRYTAVFNRFPEDIRQYWADYGEGAFPSFSVELAVERMDGEREKLSTPAKGNVIENITRWRDAETGQLTVSVFDATQYTAVFSSPESVNEETLSFTAYVDGESLATNAYSVSYRSEEYDIYAADGTPTGEKSVHYITEISVLLPDGVSAEADISFTLDIFQDGHIYTYTEHIP